MSRTSKRNRRQSKPKPQQAPRPEQAQPEPAAPEPVLYERQTAFADVEDFETGLADEKQLQLLMKDWRKGRATRTI